MRPIIGGWEPPSIEAVNAVESRRIARLAVAGLSGDLQQDLGRGAMGVQISGSLSGDEARDGFLKELRTAFYAGEPVDFVSHILEEAELERVLIERFDMAERNDAPGIFAYSLVLREYTEPPAPPDLGADLGLGLDLGLDIDLGLDLLDLAGLLGDLPDIGPLLEPVAAGAEALRGALAGVGGLLGPLEALLDSPGGAP
jgi:hypothetical protein